MGVKGKFGACSYGGGNKATYVGMGIAKVGDADSEGIILDSDNYEGEINHMGIPHERTRQRNRAIGRRTSNFAVGIRKLVVGCANCTTGRDLRGIGHRANLFAGRNDRYFGTKGDFSENEEKGDSQKARMILGTYRAFRNFHRA